MADYPELKLLINGEWISRPGQPVINPADETTIGTVPHATTADLAAAVAAAEHGFKVWRGTSPAKRAEIILKAVAIMRQRVEEMAVVMTLEQGKPIAQSRLEVQRASDIIEWDAQEGRRTYGRIIPAEPGMRHTVLRQPIGPVAAFSPWNFPVSSPSRKVGGALSAGCSIILKASEETPGGAYQLARCFVDGGLPAGVLNLVYGNPAAISEYLIPHPSIRLITFTGSIPVGKRLAAMAGQHMKPAIMELGGHAPVIVCDDVDPEAAAAAAVLGKTRNAGQVCVSPTRWFVAEKIHEPFAKAFAEKAANLKIGNGMDPANQMGPLANHRRIEAMTELVADAKAKGARCCRAARGSPIAATISRSPFCPTFRTTRVPCARSRSARWRWSIRSRIWTRRSAKANSLPYGLAAYAFTNSARNVDRLSEEIEVGNLSINHYVASIAETPFGGVKDSGYGREGGVEGLQGYTVVKNVSHLAK
jgi:succinate-semialdehyde dehydrogenase/glutarate-semialdehyde dehydrogenase